MKNAFLVTAILTICLASCKKTTTTEPTYVPPDSSYGLVYTKIFAPSCALSGCHAAEDHAAQGHSHGITLAGSAAYDDMINVTPKNAQAITAGLKMIVPSDTAKSWLYQKLIYSRSAHKYGAPMPLGGLVLTTNQIEFVRKWIAAGAPKEGHVVDKSLIN